MNINDFIKSEVYIISDYEVNDVVGIGQLIEYTESKLYYSEIRTTNIDNEILQEKINKVKNGEKYILSFEDATEILTQWGYNIQTVTIY